MLEKGSAEAQTFYAVLAVSRGVRVVHDGRVLASSVEIADTWFQRVRGLMFRRSIPEEYALVFRFETAGRRNVHMLFVPFAIDVLWLSEGRVERADQLRAWFGLASARADTLVELPAGTATGVKEGDTITFERVEADRSTRQ